MTLVAASNVGGPMAFEFSDEYSVDFSRISGAIPPPPLPPPAGSLDGTWALTKTGFIINSVGERWTITTGNKVAVNGVADAPTANVVAIYYTGGLVYHMNTSRNWYRKARARDLWQATACPVPNS